MKSLRVLMIFLLAISGFALGSTLTLLLLNPNGSTQVQTVKELEVRFPENYYRREYPSPITVEQGLDFIADARYTHQYFLDHPELMTRFRDSFTTNGFDLTVERETEWVRRYDQLRELIIRLNAGN
jgi:hypothetical protein